MEKMMTVEEKIRRAEEIYERRKQNTSRPVATVNIREKKDIKLLKKMIMQLLICVSIYLIVYSIQKNNYIFSEDFVKKTNEILSYDTNFQEIYQNAKNGITNFFNIEKKQEEEENIDSQAEEGIKEETTQEVTQEIPPQEQSQEVTQEQTQEENSTGGVGGPGDSGIEQQQNNQETLTQTEQDILMAKNTTSFIKPVEGTISSKYGRRDEATGNVPKNHTGTDIAANLGTKIKSSTEGEVVLASEEGDYRKTFKNTNRRS